MINKRGQSQIVSTVLLILLVVTAVVLIFSFVIPFVKEKLSSGDCLEVAGKVEISTGYTCYNDIDGKMQVQVHIAEIEDITEGFNIELGGASTKAVKIIEGKNGASDEVEMCDGTITLNLPGNNEERTYIFNNTEKPNAIRVYPILTGGKSCGVSDSITVIDNCFGLKKC